VIDWVKTTKDKIDDVRVVLSWAEDTINKAKQTYDDTVELIDEANQKFSDTKKAINNIAETWRGLMEIIWTWNTSSWTTLNNN